MGQILFSVNISSPTSHVSDRARADVLSLSDNHGKNTLAINIMMECSKKS